ncbi:hypothetical protein SAMN04488042_10243 [Shimia aestuarii]|uniref:Uncharacterized protein n=1 Tax=Shimia aestuarii TaxID=254406 RepID=A0A1I4LE12_9RHOB|nr:hypothetical protein SAMN04488042_10243 [Shimia aestuarii]
MRVSGLHLFTFVNTYIVRTFETTGNKLSLRLTLTHVKGFRPSFAPLDTNQANARV